MAKGKGADMAGGRGTELLDQLDSGRPYDAVRLSCEDWLAACHLVTCLPPQQIAAPRERNDRGKSGRDVKHIFTVGLCKRVLQRKHETSETQCFFSSTVEVETWDRTTHPRQPQASDVCRAMCHSCFCAHTSGRETIVTQ